jgi:hypothetical protein
LTVSKITGQGNIYDRNACIAPWMCELVEEPFFDEENLTPEQMPR